MQQLSARTKTIVLLATMGSAAMLEVQSFAQTKQSARVSIQPIQPTGYLGALGAYRTIEGVLYDGNGKVQSNTLVVDTVDGKRLDKPVLVKNVRLPAKVRCNLKGYELGATIGRPPAEYALTKELGGDPNALARRDATVWRWRPYFVPLLVAEPKGLKVSTKWGISKR